MFEHDNSQIQVQMTCLVLWSTVGYSLRKSSKRIYEELPILSALCSRNWQIFQIAGHYEEILRQRGWGIADVAGRG
jgi:hypothetical protein